MGKQMIKSNVEVVVNEQIVKYCSFSDLKMFSFFRYINTIYQKVKDLRAINMYTGDFIAFDNDDTIEPVDIKIEWSNQ